MRRMLVAAWSRRWLVVTVVLVLVVAALVPVAAAVDDDGLEVGAGLPSVDPPPAVDPEETWAAPVETVAPSDLLTMVAGDPWVTAAEGERAMSAGAADPVAAEGPAAPGMVADQAGATEDPGEGVVGVAAEPSLAGSGDRRSEGSDAPVTGDAGGDPSSPEAPGSGTAPPTGTPGGMDQDPVGSGFDVIHSGVVQHEQVPKLWVRPDLASAPVVDVTRDKATVDALRTCAAGYGRLLDSSVDDTAAAVAMATCAAGSAVVSRVVEPAGPATFVVKGDPEDPRQWWLCEADRGSCRAFDPSSLPLAALDPDADPVSWELAGQLFDVTFTDNPEWWPVRQARTTIHEPLAWALRGFHWDDCIEGEDGIRHCVDPDYVGAPGAKVAPGVGAIYYFDPSGFFDETLVREQRRRISLHAMLGRNFQAALAIGDVLHEVLHEAGDFLRELGSLLRSGSPLEALGPCVHPMEIGDGDMDDYGFRCIG